MKRLLKIILAGILSISLIGCASNSNETNDEVVDNTDTLEESEETEEDTQIIGNVLMADSGYDKYVLGSEYEREDIITITFLDSLDEMPSSAWDVSANKDGSVMAWVTDSGEDKASYNLYIAGNGGVIANEDSSHLFWGYYNLSEIDFNSNFDTSKATDMSNMFAYCDSLTTLDLSCYDTSKVTDMSEMFLNCHEMWSLETSSNFVTSNADTTDMYKETNWE